jgi:ribonucleoside-diphosphate reductase alpha chain
MTKINDEIIDLSDIEYEIIEITDKKNVIDYTMDISVDDTHYYVLDNGVISHNTVSLMTQTTSGIEPAFLIRYKRKRKVNPNDKGLENVKLEYDNQGDAWEMYEVYHKGFKDWAEINNHNLENISDEEFNKLYGISPYYLSTSADVDWVAKVRLQAEIQKWIDHSISVTVNLPNSATEEIVSDVYMTAWKSGCKGITVYRDGSRDGVLISNENNPRELLNFDEVNAPKRPTVLEADVVHFNNKGEKWIGVMGLLKNKPYELFTGKLESFNIPDKITTGLVTRVKDNGESRYDFQYYDDDGFKVTMEELNRAFDRETWNYSRLISGILRHGMPLGSLYDLIDNLKLADGDAIVSWKTGIKRLIKKYIKNGTKISGKCPECGSTIIFTDGCKKCSNCDYSACG